VIYREQQERLDAFKSKPVVTSADWREMATSFETVSKSVVHAGYQAGGFSGTELWSLGGVPAQAKQCGALCKIAGAMLLRSPNVAKRVSAETLAVEDEADRWLKFLKENHSAMSRMDYAIETDDLGNRKPIFMGTILDVPGASRVACLDSAALEL
jgi:hypothetical protein